MIQPRTAIIIVTYNSAAEIGACLTALSQLDGVEILVVDNASSDSTLREVQRTGVRLIANRENRGFAAAVNQGVRASTAPLVLLLNPDTRLLHGLEALEAAFVNPKTGAAGGLLVAPGGEPQTGFFVRRLPTPLTLIFEVSGLNRLWPHNPVNWRYRCFDLDPTIAQNVEQPAGAFLMFRRSAWEALAGFDERFWPIWFEDVDFCARLRTAGWIVCYEPKAIAIHQGAHSIRLLSVEKRQAYWYRSLLGYGGKHFSPFIFRTICLAVAAGVFGRALASLPRAGTKNLAVYAGICWLALRRFAALRPDETLLLSDVKREI